MNTYTFRDLRRQTLSSVLDGLGDVNNDFTQLMKNELAALQGDDWTVTDRTYLAVAEDSLWTMRLTLKATVDSDIVFAARGIPSSLTDAQAAAIEGLPNNPGGPQAGYLDQVKAALGGDEAVFNDLVQTLHYLWWRAQPGDQRYPFDDVGVLLPLRLETLFDAPNTTFNQDPTRWRISLRVTPDEPSICRDDPHVSADEHTALIAFWRAVKQPGDLSDAWLDMPDAGIAWKQLSDRVTAPRAAWLVATFSPQIQGDGVNIELPADMPAEPQPNRVGGMPPELRVFVINNAPINGSDRIAIGRLPQDPNAQIDHKNLLLPLPGRKEDKGAWWASWETAKSVGVGGTWLLPDGVTPDTIRVLYVLGIGDEPPDDHFKAQVDAGELGLLHLGAATNTVHGKASAGVGQADMDWRKVAQLRLRQRLGMQQNPPVAVATPTGQSVERAITGSVGGLPFYPGADSGDETQMSRHLLNALWPAIYGVWFHDIYQKGEDAFRLGLWASRFVLPEGPLMPLRIANQPYGLLPVTALAQWTPADAFDAESQAMNKALTVVAKALTTARSDWAGTAEGNGTVVQKSSAQFMDILGQESLSSNYILRTYADAWDWTAAYGLGLARRHDFKNRATKLYAIASDKLGLKPAHSLLAYGPPQDNGLPLVQPTRMTLRDPHNPQPVDLMTFIDEVYKHPGVGLDDLFNQQHFDTLLWHVMPDSLLIRLLTYAIQVASNWRKTLPQTPATEQLLDMQFKEAMRIAEQIDRPEWRSVVKDPQTGIPTAFVLTIPIDLRLQFERALRATLDSAAHRIDPWVTGFAWQRLQQLSASPRHASRLGVYGWLDGPFVGSSGPTDAGRLHTPSFNQTLAALILRDKYLSSGRVNSRNDSGRNPWEMNIASSRARLAEQIADEVRMGFHIYEVLGRLVEYIVAQPQKVRDLRRSNKYAMRAERLDPNEVCNGMEALKGLLAGDPDFPMDDKQTLALQQLNAALDTYGDLLMADGVMQLVNHQIDRAAESMDAASGFSRPPTFEFLRTPPSGYQLESMILSTLPYVAVDGLGNDASPIRLVDPSLAAYVESKFPDGWTWQAANADANNAVVGQVSLAELGLAISDTVALSADLLGELARHKLGLPQVFISESRNRAWLASDPQNNPLGTVSLVELKLTPEALAKLDDLTLQARIRAALGIPDASVITEIILSDPRLWIASDENGALLGLVSTAGLALTPAQVDALSKDDLYRQVRQKLSLPQVVMIAPRQYQLAQQLVAALSSRPASARDFGGDRAAQAAVDAAIYDELRGRYIKLYAAGQQMSADLRAAALAADNAERTAALRRTLAWGLTPLSDPADRAALLAALTGTTPPTTATPLDILCNSDADVLDKRLADAVKPDDLVTTEQMGAPLVNHKDLKQKGIPDGVPTMARALANLAAPNAKLALLACWPRDLLTGRTGVGADKAAPSLDETWLTVVAATRANLARLEALQLELAQPLNTWSSSPDDPWQKDLVQKNLDRRDNKIPARENESPLGLSTPAFVAAYGTTDAWAGDKVAVGMIDAFSEAIPMPHRTTMTAFGFNAPAARAPQTILLAVPPRIRQRLDIDLLLQIAVETRELAHGRMTHVEDLNTYQALTPTMMMQVNGPVSAWLQPWPLFE